MGRRLRRVLSVLPAIVLAGSPAPALAQVDGPCTATFSGVEIELIDSISRPLELQADEILVFAGTSTDLVTEALVEVYVGPVRVERVRQSFPDGTTDFVVEVEVGDIAPYSVGLMSVTASAGECTARGWLRVTGRSFFTTLAAVVAMGLVIGGLAAQTGAIASRQTVAPLAAALGGVFTGTGVALLGQQMGRLHLSYWSVGLIVAISSAAGAFLALFFNRPPAPARVPRSADVRDKLRGMASPAAEVRPIGMTDMGPRPDAPPPVAPKAGPPPYWAFVLDEVVLVDLDDHERRVATLRPGTWYLVKSHHGLWGRVVAGGTEGWAPLRSLHHQAEAQERSSTS